MPLGNGVLSAFELRRRFPCAFVVAIADPFDKVFSLALGVNAFAIDFFDFEVVLVVDVHRRRPDVGCGSTVLLQVYNGDDVASPVARRDGRRGETASQ